LFVSGRTHNLLVPENRRFDDVIAPMRKA